ncbi:MAG: hypothetical protein QHH24_03365 [Candidatus Bathyarchaeota archaeon]|jgi:hypothetical protein|nr:hypothetical protein [Candidatus Bathyarchaeota archaeon]
MSRKDRTLASNRSGQMLIVAALAIAILISTTVMYAYELAKEQYSQTDREISDFIQQIKLATRNMVASSLANTSNNAGSTAITANSAKISQLVRSLHLYEVSNLSLSPRNDSTYREGIKLSWTSNGAGTSSAYVDAVLHIKSFSTDVTARYSVNVTTTMMIDGYYVVAGSEKHVTLTCRAYNENKSSSVGNVTLYYGDNGNWIQVTDYSTVSYGNGTYVFSFFVSIPTDNVEVTAHVLDLRGIYVQANVTCCAQ